MWQIGWEFNKPVFQPGDEGKVYLWLENIGMAPIYVSEVGIQFDWQGDYWFPSRAKNTLLDSGKKQQTGSVEFEVPCNIVGGHHFRLGVKSDEWSAPEWTGWLKINIGIFPKLKAFVSRLGPPEEKERVRPLLEAIEAWGFEIYTYEGPDTPEVPYIIAKAIREWADCHIVIATSQFYDYVHSIGQTSPWLHREFFGAFTLGKPSIIFRERGVYFDGLLSPTIPTIEFSSMEEAIPDAHILLPQLRESIFVQKRAKSSPWIWGLIGGVLTIGLATAFAVSSSKGKGKDKE
jgi:hypothetical protein